MIGNDTSMSDSRADVLDGPSNARSFSGVFELGAHSLKLHCAGEERVETVKYPYALGHEVYSTGTISESTTQRILSVLDQSPVRPGIGIGTSAIRDAENRESFLCSLRRQSIEFHVLSRWEEASLLARGYLAQSKELPALVADVGGGSLELVYLNKAGLILWDSLPVGAIRLYHDGAGRDRGYWRERLEECFRRFSVIRAGQVYVTGGTARAVAKTLSKSTFTKRDLEELEERVRRRGVPSQLKPTRAIVFLSGIVLLRAFLDRMRTRKLHYVGISVGRVFLHARANGRCPVEGGLHSPD